MKKLVWAFCIAIISYITVSGQGVLISPIPGQPHPSAGLEVNFTDRGFLPPRLTTTQRNAIVSPAIGLMIYNTTTACAEMYFPNGWKSMGCNCNSFPNSQFTNSSATTNANVTFTPQNIPGATYSWTFQSGNPATSNVQNPVVVWANAGTYTVTLTVTDNQGCSSTTTNTVTVSNCPSPGSNVFTFNHTGAAQTWTVPQTCATNITIEARGGAGGNGQSAGTGGLGARIIGTYNNIAPGTVLEIIVGGAGVSGQPGNASRGGGGGGGSFVYSQGGNPTLYIAAGGGGGGGFSTGNGGPGLTSNTGGNGSSGSVGGSNGNGGGIVTSNGYDGGGGAGWLSNGQSNTQASGGRTRVNGWTGGGANAYSPLGTNGGFGGGGGAEHGAGGGGGYSGGGGGYNGSPYGAGGGGSYNNGTNQTNTQGYQSGNGQVIISY